MYAVTDEYGLASKREMKGMRPTAEKIVMIERRRVMWGDWDEKEAENLRGVLPFGKREWEKKRECERYFNKIIKKD